MPPLQLPIFGLSLRDFRLLVEYLWVIGSFVKIGLNIFNEIVSYLALQ